MVISVFFHILRDFKYFIIYLKGCNKCLPTFNLTLYEWLLLERVREWENLLKILEFYWKQYFLWERKYPFFLIQHSVCNLLRISFKPSCNGTQNWEVLFISKWKTMVVYKLPQINWWQVNWWFVFQCIQNRYNYFFHWIVKII